LNLEAYGPAFKPAISAEAMVARNLKSPYPAGVEDSPAVRRRSVYMFHKRVIPYPLLQAFDRPDSLQSCGVRDRTTVAPQAQALLNDGVVRDCAEDFADRLIREGGGEDARLVERAFVLALARPPSETERSASLEFLRSRREARRTRDPDLPDGEASRRALADYCQSIFGLNEFIYID
jgi:hypothetical protein